METKKISRPQQKATAVRRAYFLVLAAFTITLVSGCPSVSTDGGGGDGNGGTDNTGTGGVLAGDIINIRTTTKISELDPFVSVLYNLDNVPAGADIRGFYIPVTGTIGSYMDSGDLVVVATGLLSVDGQSFRFDPGSVGPGSYQVGVAVTTIGSETQFRSRAAIDVQAAPDPTFILPNVSVSEISQGTSVPVTFDTGALDTSVQWRLFLLQNSDSRTSSADIIGTELVIGQGNIGAFTLSTDALLPGDFQLGLSATLSGASIAATVAQGNENLIVTNVDGPIVRVVTPQGAILPTLTFTTPGSTSVSVTQPANFTIEFLATVLQPGATGTIELFYDTDRDPLNGFISLAGAASLPTTQTTFAVDSSLLPVGIFNIGGSVFDGINDEVFTYATGTLQVVAAP